MIKRLMISFILREFQINHTIFVQGMKPTHAYVVYEGEFELVKLVKIQNKEKNSGS